MTTPVFSSQATDKAVCRWCLTVIQTVLDDCEHDERPDE